MKAPRHWPLCGEFTGTGEFPAQRASYAENVSIWWRHHVRLNLNSVLVKHHWSYCRYEQSHPIDSYEYNFLCMSLSQLSYVSKRGLSRSLQFDRNSLKMEMFPFKMMLMQLPSTIIPKQCQCVLNFHIVANIKFRPMIKRTCFKAPGSYSVNSIIH